ncbi:MAG TPA: c-type cytochrome [Chthoniobacteraceae bacterium]|jgi:putative heme-binding domain-containing protein|nr:c-type cytochrome [Chthoniobacteraceae bacterium]
MKALVALLLLFGACALAEDRELNLKELRAQQRTLRRLAAEPGPEADREIARRFDELDAGRLPFALWLDVLEAAAKRPDPALRARLAERARVEAASNDPLRAWRECLEGGDANEGREIFHQKPVPDCIRCHRVGKEGGEIGPNLTALSQRAQRIAILESIIEPNASIVPGFSNLLVKLKDGRELAGIVSAESTDLMTLTSQTDGKKTTFRTSDIVTETGLPSAMPPAFGQILGKRAIRDLVEFLATQE